MVSMSRVEGIEVAIRGLSFDEWSALRAWFAEQDAEHWDRQIEGDVKAGRLDALADKALADAFAG